MIGIIGAMQEEVNEILALANCITKIEINKNVFYQAKIADNDVVIVLSGIGKTLSTISTTLLLTKFDIDIVINIGTAGGLKKDQEVLDIVVCDRLAYHDYDMYVEHWDYKKGFDYNKAVYNADQKLIEIFKDLANTNHDRIWIGPAVSGDMFVNKKSQVTKILKEYPEALCSEMEAASIAQTCNQFDIPFIIIRSLSDITVNEGNDVTFDEYVSKASVRSAKYTKLFIEKYQTLTKK